MQAKALRRKEELLKAPGWPFVISSPATSSGSVSDLQVYLACGLLPSGPLSGSVYNRFSQAYLRLLIGEIGGNSTKRPFRLPLDIATKLEKWIRPPKFFPCRKLLHVL